METKENLNKNSVILIFISAAAMLIMAILFVGVLYPMLDQKETNSKESVVEDSTSTVQDDNLQITAEQVEKLAAAFSSYFPIEDVSKIDNQLLLRFAQQMILDSYSNGFTKEDIEAVINNYFGNSVKVTHENIKCEATWEQNGKTHPDLFLYDGNGKYTYNSEHGGHGIGGVFLKSKYISTEKNNNKIMINYKFIGFYHSDIWGGETEDDYIDVIYKSEMPKNKRDDTGNCIDEKGNHIQCIDPFDYVPTTSFTYEKDSNGTYNLKSITKK